MEAIFLPSSEFFVAKGVKWKVQVRLQISSKKHITSDIIPWRKKRNKEKWLTRKTRSDENKINNFSILGYFVRKSK